MKSCKKYFLQLSKIYFCCYFVKELLSAKYYRHIHECFCLRQSNLRPKYSEVLFGSSFVYPIHIIWTFFAEY